MANGTYEHQLLEAVARHDERIRDLEDWRKVVNGDLRDIREKVTWIGWGVAATLGAALLNLLIGRW